MDYRVVSISANQFEIEPQNNLELGDAVTFQGSGQVTSENKKDNQDGNSKIHFKIQPSLLEVRKSVDGEVIEQPVVKTFKSGKRSQSQRLRDNLYVLWESVGMPGDFEDYYFKMMEKIIQSVNRKIEE